MSMNNIFKGRLEEDKIYFLNIISLMLDKKIYFKNLIIEASDKSILIEKEWFLVDNIHDFSFGKKCRFIKAIQTLKENREEFDLKVQELYLKQMEKSGLKMDCPHCKKENSMGVKFCKCCGKDLYREFIPQAKPKTIKEGDYLKDRIYNINTTIELNLKMEHMVGYNCFYNRKEEYFDWWDIEEEIGKLFREKKIESGSKYKLKIKIEIDEE